MATAASCGTADHSNGGRLDGDRRLNSLETVRGEAAPASAAQGDLSRVCDLDDKQLVSQMRRPGQLEVEAIQGPSDQVGEGGAVSTDRHK